MICQEKKIHTRKAQEDQSKLIEMNLNLTDSMNANAVSLDRSDPKSLLDLVFYAFLQLSDIQNR